MMGQRLGAWMHGMRSIGTGRGAEVLAKILNQQIRKVTEDPFSFKSRN